MITLAAVLVTVARAAPAPKKPVVVRYMMWDSAQLPVYRQCAADFMARRPDIQVRISQAGWDDYWTTISTGFIAGVAPDVFHNHLTKFPAFAANGLLEDLEPYRVRDGLDRVDPAETHPLLLQAWRREGRQYALPKDWDTVALLVNLQHAASRGVTHAEIEAAQWNPRDGGSFERIIRRLTVDTAGRDALHPDFDPKRVAVYGYQTPGAGGMAGQTEWSHFAVSNGYRFQTEPWAPLRYDDPRLAETLDWMASLPAKGLSMRDEQVRGLGAAALWAAGRVAMVPEGSWMVGFIARQARHEYAWVPLPLGPTGQRASMFNGLGDSMWAGSKVKEAAWAWMKHLASEPCQRRIAAGGVMFPALRRLTPETMAVHRQLGVDSSAFVTMSEQSVFLTPIAPQGAQVNAAVRTAIESVLAGQQPAAQALRQAQQRIDTLRR